MNFMLRALACLLGLHNAVGSDTTSGSPVERIVRLLETLKDKTVDDGKHEQAIYDRYACFCETTSKRKADDIDQGTSNIRSLGQRILQLKGQVQTRSAEIAELTDKINANDADQESLTAGRQKQNSAWAASTAEVKQALSALEAAISVLSAATTKDGASALVQESQQARSKYAVNAVLDKLPSRIGLSPGRMAMLSEFTAAKEGYAPQSATIQGMLGDMYLTFSGTLESDTLQEANRNAAYESLSADTENETNELKDTRDRKETEKAEAEAMLADTTKAYEDTQKQKDADIEFFEETKKACESKFDEWELRKKMRGEEIDGMEQAIEILSSDETRALFDKAIQPGVGFLQINSSPSLLQSSSGTAAVGAYNILRTQAKKLQSVRLAALAVQIRTARIGEFDKVDQAIDKMLVKLEKEGNSDLEKKEQCKTEYQSISKTVNDLDWDIENNEAKIAKFDKLIELRTGEKTATALKIKETAKYIEDITAQRKEDHELWEQTTKNDEAAVVELKRAKNVFEKFYNKNVKGAVFSQEPDFRRSDDDAPDATLSDKGNNKGKTKGILALFEYILEDLADELSNGAKAETEAQSEFEEEAAIANKLLKDMKEKETNLKAIIGKRLGQKKEQNVDLKSNNGDREEELSYKTKITPDCDFILQAFDQRAEARAAEVEGLTSAKQLLAGKTALLQESRNKFDNSKSHGTGFLGISH